MEFRLVSDSGGPGFVRHVFAGDTLYLDSLPLLSDPDLSVVRADVRDTVLDVRFELTPRAAARYRVQTGRNIERRLAALLEGRVTQVLTINSALGPRGVITYVLSGSEARRLASLMKERWPD